MSSIMRFQYRAVEIGDEDQCKFFSYMSTHMPSDLAAALVICLFGVIHPCPQQQLPPFTKSVKYYKVSHQATES